MDQEMVQRNRLDKSRKFFKGDSYSGTLIRYYNFPTTSRIISHCNYKFQKNNNGK